MTRRILTAAASLLVLVACGNDDKLPGAATPDATAPQRPGRAAAAAAPGPATAVDPAIPGYEAATGVSGDVRSVGSDTMGRILTQWGESLARTSPGIKLAVQASGSATAPPALTDGTAQVAAMSRPMKPAEIDAFEKKHGYKPTEVRAALDAVAVFVHKDNPLDKLTLAQADAIFSRTRKLGAAGDVTTWGDLGLAKDWAARPIHLHGRSAASGTRAFFKERVLKNGDFKDGLKEHAGSAALVQAVAADLDGIGYGGIGHRTSGVRMVPLVTETGATSSGGHEDVVKGTYPLARFLHLVVDRAPGKPLAPAVAELLGFALSRQGQEVVAQDGYLPLTLELVQQERAKLQ